MSAAAAFFDLDRTIITDSTSSVFQRHLQAAGIASERNIPGADVFGQVYRVLGENRALMQLAKYGVRVNAGWSVDDVAAATSAAAEELVDMVLPYALIEIAEHRAAGRKLVLATTSPDPWVRPLAELLEFDDVIATKWESSAGVYTGRLDGRFTWGRGKKDAVVEWAEANGVNLKSSYAYSDSRFDVPMLRSVGHPVAVNPDLQLEGIARLNGWPVRNFDVPDGVLKVAGREIQDWLRPINRPDLAAPNARFDIQGTENIPSDGPVIVVFNHRSYFDAIAVNFTLAKAGRPARFLGKKEVFDAPVVGAINTAMGGIRVDRGTGSEEPLDRAIAALEAGELICIAPEGTIPRGPAFFDPELKGRWGAARLAAATKAPVVTLSLWGTEKVWPRNQRFPKMDLTDRPEITVRVGPPVKLAYKSPDADTKRIMKALVKHLPAEAREHRTPTADELAATYPSGYQGEPELELSRRPGTDT